MTSSQLISNYLDCEIDPAYAIRAKYIIDVSQKIKPKKILDCGCGRGFYIKLLSLFNFPTEIIGIDLNQKYLSLAKKTTQDSNKVKLIQGSVYQLPFADNYFDLVIASEILEHLEYDQKAIIEIKRVMKKNALLIITVPNYHFPLLWDPLNWIMMKLFSIHINKDIWWLSGIWANHERLYTEKQIINITRKYLKIIETKKIISHCWPFSHFLLYGIGKNLVEKFGINSFNRFSYQPKKISKLLAQFFNLPSRLLDHRVESKSSMNIIVLASKK